MVLHSKVWELSWRLSVVRDTNEDGISYVAADDVAVLDADAFKILPRVLGIQPRQQRGFTLQHYPPLQLNSLSVAASSCCTNKYYYFINDGATAAQRQLLACARPLTDLVAPRARIFLLLYVEARALELDGRKPEAMERRDRAAAFLRRTVWQRQCRW